MKLGIFTDSHYSSQTLTCACRWNSRSLGKIKTALAAFRAAGCDLVVSLGDLIDREETHEQEIARLREIADALHTANLPTVCLMGNHDAFAFTHEEFYAVLGGFRPEDLHVGNTSLLFLDSCYFSDGRHYQPGDSDWTDTFLPDLPSLERRLKNSGGNAYVFLHQNIDPTVRADHCLSNAAAVRALLEESGKVRAVFQGHYHKGSRAAQNGID